jgi:peptidoglycan/LPS O-acetylase OafA/YrhL
MLSKQPWFDLLKPAAKGKLWLRMTFTGLILYIVIGITTLGISPVVYLPISCILISSLVTAAVFARNIIAFTPALQQALDALAPRTYSLYAVHFPVILVMNEYFRDTEITSMMLLQKILLTLFFIAIGCELLYQAILTPWLKKGKKIADALLEKNKDDDLITAEAR